MYLFPPTLIYHSIDFQIIIFGSKTCIVRTKRANQNKRNKTTQKDDHHEGVKDGKPMNLMFKKIKVVISFIASRKSFIGWNPRNRKSERVRVSCYDGHWIFECQIDFNDPIFV